MDERRGLTVDTLLGLVLVTLGCTNGPSVGDGNEESGTGDGDGAGDGESGTGTGDGTGDGDGDGGDGDGDGDTGSDAFELVSAEIDGTGQLVTLHFSKPVAPVDAVDPADFRISHAMPDYLVSDMGETPETTYWDANFYVDYYLSYDAPSMTHRFVVDSISAGDDAHDVRLHFGMPLDPAFCEYFIEFMVTYPNYQPLFVHHSPSDIPLSSTDGEPLEAIGAQWVEEQFPVATVPGDYLVNLDPQISIPCPQ